MAAITFKCPNCGGGLVFNPETQQYKCEFCLSQFGLKELKEWEAGLKAQDDKERKGQGEGQEGVGLGEKEESRAVVYHCPSCGAEIVTDETTAASFCYYCHNPVVLEGRLDGRFSPDYVVPFAIDRKKAEEIFRQWIRGKRYVPAGFYSEQQIASMTGVYFPYWLYRCNVEGKMEAEGMKLRVWDAGNLRYTEKKTYHISRSGQMPVKDVARNALKKANAKLSAGVLPFPPDGLQPFHIGYLTGFQAEKRDMEKEQIKEAVEREVKDLAVSNLKGSASGYSSLRVQQLTAQIQDASWHYGLFPVWTLTYKSPRNGKIYYFALNGQTGKVCGELPVDGKKLLFLFLSVFSPLMALLLVLGYMI